MSRLVHPPQLQLCNSLCSDVECFLGHAVCLKNTLKHSVCYCCHLCSKWTRQYPFSFVFQENNPGRIHMELNKTGYLWQGEDGKWGQEREENISLYTIVSILNFLPVHIVYLKAQFQNVVHKIIHWFRKLNNWVDFHVLYSRSLIFCRVFHCWEDDTDYCIFSQCCEMGQAAVHLYYYTSLNIQKIHGSYI